MGSCPKKIKARYDTIIAPYRQHFGKSIPKDRQYWSIAGSCIDNKKVIEGTELHQIISEKLITPKQFHGVEIQEDIFNINKSYKSNWYLGDLYEVIVNSRNFNPAIINVDSLWMPKKGMTYFAKIMAYVDSVCNEVMLVGNFILRARWKTVSIEEIIKELDKCPQFHSVWDNGEWKYNNKVYVYNGTGSKHTIMGSVVFIKK